MNRHLLISALLLLLGSRELSAQAGSTGLAFLKLGVGARALGMGEAYTAIANDPAATYYNPGALSLTDASQFLLMHKQWIQDTRTEFFAAKTTMDRVTLAVSLNSTSVDNIEIRDVPGPPVGTFTSHNAAIGASGAYRIDPDLSVGATVKYLYEKILVDEASGYGIDLGAVYRTPWEIRLGLAVSNLGSMSALVLESSKLPTVVRFGAGYETALASIDATLSASADAVSYTGEGRTHLHAGAELDYKRTFAVRAGYQTGYEAKGVSAGVGITYDLLTLDYAFVPFGYDLGTTHTFSLKLEL
jgi:hypothetical protein